MASSPPPLPPRANRVVDNLQQLQQQELQEEPQPQKQLSKWPAANLHPNGQSQVSLLQGRRVAEAVTPAPKSGVSYAPATVARSQRPQRPRGIVTPSDAQLLAFAGTASGEAAVAAPGEIKSDDDDAIAREVLPSSTSATADAKSETAIDTCEVATQTEAPVAGGEMATSPASESAASAEATAVSASASSPAVDPASAAASSASVDPASVAASSAAVDPASATASSAAVDPASAAASSAAVDPASVSASSAAVHPASAAASSAAVEPASTSASSAAVDPASVSASSAAVDPASVSASSSAVDPASASASSATVDPASAADSLAPVDPASAAASSAAAPASDVSTSSVAYAEAPHDQHPAIPDVAASDDGSLSPSPGQVASRIPVRLAASQLGSSLPSPSGSVPSSRLSRGSSLSINSAGIVQHHYHHYHAGARITHIHNYNNCTITQHNNRAPTVEPSE